MEFTLKDWDSSYADTLYQYANNQKIADNLRDGFPIPYTKEDAIAYISDCTTKGNEKQYTKAIVVDGEAVGSIGVFFGENIYRKTAELGYWLGEPFWGQGIMSAAVAQICCEVFANYDIVRIFAEPYAYNSGSRRVLEHAGFTLEGIRKNGIYKNGQVLDDCLYALTR